MTNEEIWKMLEGKMEKNGLKTYYRVTPYHHILSYDCADAQKAIAIAYRSGYERAMKGRPFKIGEKKKKGGHWEPINIEQYEYLETYKIGEDDKLYQWREDNE